jgi:hypothetical protein
MCQVPFSTPNHQGKSAEELVRDFNLSFLNTEIPKFADHEMLLVIIWLTQVWFFGGKGKIFCNIKN